MDHFLPEIFWHDRQGLLSIDIDSKNTGNDRYRIVTCSMQKELRIWELVFEKCPDRDITALSVNFLANISGHHASINIAQFTQFSGAKMLASGDSEGRLIVWSLSNNPCGPAEVEDLPPNKENWVKHKMIHHDGDVTYLAWQPNGTKLASIGRDNNLLIHDTIKGKRILSVYNLREFPNGIAWDPLGKFIVTQSTDRKLEIIDAMKGTKLRLIYSTNFPTLHFNGHSTDANQCKMFHDDQIMTFKRVPAFSPCGQIIVVPCVHIESRDKNFYGNYVFTRKELASSGRPSWIMPAPQVTFLIKMCPIIMELDPNTKENYTGLAYRVLWLALTKDSVIFYDSQHSSPIAYVDNIHYNKLTDASWNHDGSVVAITSLEGYCSFLRISVDKWGCQISNMPAVEKTPEKAKMTKGSKRKLSAPNTHTRSSQAITPKSNILNFFRVTPKQNKSETTPTERPPQKRIKIVSLD